MGIADLPPIQLSICKIFGIGNLADEDVMESLLHRGTVPIFARTTDDFWNKLDRRGDRYRLGDFIAKIEFWNGTASRWDLIFDDKSQDVSMVDMRIYPYEVNSTLLCHTLRSKLVGFGTKFRLVTSLDVDLRK